jgi:hypothetical protein
MKNNPAIYMMIRCLLTAAFFISCKTEKKGPALPDLRPNFLNLLNRRDSTLTLDSFYFISIDTMTAKKAYTHQRFTFLHLMERINGQLDRLSKYGDSFHLVPSAGELEKIETLKEEKAYVGKEIDSFNILIAGADSITPVGYRALYKVTVSKKDQFAVSDTIPYSITLQGKISDWDRNVEKTIDSLAIGKPGRRGGTD